MFRIGLKALDLCGSHLNESTTRDDEGRRWIDGAVGPGDVGFFSFFFCLIYFLGEEFWTGEWMFFFCFFDFCFFLGVGVMDFLSASFWVM